MLQTKKKTYIVHIVHFSLYRRNKCTMYWERTQVVETSASQTHKAHRQTETHVWGQQNRQTITPHAHNPSHANHTTQVYIHIRQLNSGMQAFTQTLGYISTHTQLTQHAACTYNHAQIQVRKEDGRVVVTKPVLFRQLRKQSSNWRPLVSSNSLTSTAYWHPLVVSAAL